MNKFAKFALLSAAVAAATVTASAPAQAGGRHPPRHYQNNNNDAAVLGLFGLAAGVVVGAAIASEPRYVEPEYRPRYAEPVYRPRYVEPGYYPPQPAYQPYQSRYVNSYPPVPAAAALEPWSPAWYRYCSDRYRSFNAQTGTYMGYDGNAHFCTAG